MLKLHLLIYCVLAHTATAHMWRSEEGFQELVLSHHVGPGDRTPVFRVASKLLFLLSHLEGPNILSLIFTSRFTDGNAETYRDE